MTVPLNQTVEIIDDYAKSDYIDGQSGYWKKVRYGDIVGYAWGNYLRKQ